MAPSWTAGVGDGRQHKGKCGQEPGMFCGRVYLEYMTQLKEAKQSCSLVLLDLLFLVASINPPVPVGVKLEVFQNSSAARLSGCWQSFSVGRLLSCMTAESEQAFGGRFVFLP